MGAPVKFMDVQFVCDEGGKKLAGCDGKCIENKVVCIHLTVKEANPKKEVDAT